MLRNRELARMAALAVAATAAVACAAAALGAAQAVPWVVAAAAAVGAVFAAYTRARYARLADLAQAVDSVLHGTRDVSIASMSEGELSILADEVDKLCCRLTLTAEELAREKSALADSLADVSHQLRTPLTSLEIVLELLRKKELSPAARAEKLRCASELLGRIEWLVESLLALARIDAGTVELACEPVDVRSLVRAAVEPLAVSYDVRGVGLAVEVEPGCTFTGDAAWTAEALGNILKNCLEHSPAGGTVRVSAREDALACRIHVEDDGPGFSPEDLPHVFERFYRGNAGGDPAAAGVGIGLALAQELVRAQGGRIACSNAPGGGARFDVAFFKATV